MTQIYEFRDIPFHVKLL